MNWTPSPETHRVDSSGRIQDEPATVQPQDSIFEMAEAELDEIHINDFVLFRPQVRPPPEEPQTLPRPSNPRPRPLTDSSGRLDFRAMFLAQGLKPPILLQQLENMPSPETHSVDSPGRIQDEPATVQMTEAELDDFREDSFVNDVVLSQGLEPSTAFQPQDVPPPEEPQTQKLPRRLTSAELDEFTDSSGRLNLRAMFLAQGIEPPSILQQLENRPLPETHRVSGRIQDEPATVQPQDSIFQMIEAELDDFPEESFINYVFLSQGLDVPPPEEPQTLPRPSNSVPRPLTDAELDEFTDSSGRLDVRAILLAQGIEPPSILQELENRPSPETHRVDNSGRIQDELATPPPETPMGLSEETISKYLKTMNADEIRAHNKDGDRKICAVCLDDVCGQKDVVAILDDCGHEFHFCCLKKWLNRKNICPLCRGTAIFLLGDDR